MEALNNLRELRASVRDYASQYRDKSFPLNPIPRTNNSFGCHFSPNPVKVSLYRLGISGLGQHFQ